MVRPHQRGAGQSCASAHGCSGFPSAGSRCLGHGQSPTSIAFNQYHCCYLCLPPDPVRSRLHGPGQRPEVRVRGTLGLLTSTSPLPLLCSRPASRRLRASSAAANVSFWDPWLPRQMAEGQGLQTTTDTSPVPALLSAPSQQRDGITRPDQESAGQWTPTPQGGERSLFATPWSGGHAGKTASRLETSPSVHSLFGIWSLKTTPSSTGILSFYIHITLPRGPRPTASSQTQTQTEQVQAQLLRVKEYINAKMNKYTNENLRPRRLCSAGSVMSQDLRIMLRSHS